MAARQRSPLACASADSFAELEAPTIPTFVIYTFCVANVFLTSLQFIWGGLILRAIYKITIKGEKVD